MTRVTRRQAITRGLRAGAGTLGLAAGGFSAAGVTLIGCGGAPASTGSTLRSTWTDPVGDGQLRIGPGERLLDRTDLAPAASAVSVLATLTHVTDAHVLDASSPGRVTFLDRLGAPFQSTFRPQEALTVQVLAGMISAIRRVSPDAVIQGGDLIDNAQSNELTQGLAVFAGGTVSPGSGPHGYYGVQSAFNPDPFYYRPDVDAPRHPGLLRSVGTPFVSRGLGAPAYPVFGDHDALLAGEIVPTPLTRALAVGDRALWDLRPGLSVPPGARAQATASPDGPPDPGLVDEFLREALAGATVRVPADPGRRELSLAEAASRLRAAAGGRLGRATTRTTERLDYAVDVGAHLRLIVLDLVRREGGSGGRVAPDQPAWLAHELAAAGARHVIVVSHQPLDRSGGGERLLAVLDRAPRVIAALYGHTHRNRVVPRPTPSGGYWLIGTASLIDYPQQARVLRLLGTRGGGVALQTWMLDHTWEGPLGTIARQLSYLDAQGGRPNGFAGGRLDRNVTLHR